MFGPADVQSRPGGRAVGIDRFSWDHSSFVWFTSRVFLCWLLLCIYDSNIHHTPEWCYRWATANGLLVVAAVEIQGNALDQIVSPRLFTASGTGRYLNHKGVNSIACFLTRTKVEVRAQAYNAWCAARSLHARSSVKLFMVLDVEKRCLKKLEGFGILYMYLAFSQTYDIYKLKKMQHQL